MTIIITIILIIITILLTTHLSNIDYELEKLNENIQNLLINKTNTVNEQDYIKQCEEQKIKH